MLQQACVAVDMSYVSRDIVVALSVLEVLNVSCCIIYRKWCWV